LDGGGFYYQGNENDTYYLFNICSKSRTDERGNPLPCFYPPSDPCRSEECAAYNSDLCEKVLDAFLKEIEKKTSRLKVVREWLRRRR
jgi:hypothetical protein